MKKHIRLMASRRRYPEKRAVLGHIEFCPICGHREVVHFSNKWDDCYGNCETCWLSLK